jgi:uncharacterized protein (TIGR02246 family)
MSTEDQEHSAISPEAEVAVREVVKSPENAFNAHGGIVLSEQFAEEASWPTVVGHHVDGRRAIAEFCQATMPELSDQFARYEVVSLRPRWPNVVAMHVMPSPWVGCAPPHQQRHGCRPFHHRQGSDWLAGRRVEPVLPGGLR